MDENGDGDAAQVRDATHEKWLIYAEQQRKIATDQENLLLDLMNQKNELSEQLKKYEFDNWTLRGALTQLRQESEGAMKELAYIKNDQSLIVCLLDGDGAIFSPEYLKQGETGGRRAAETLANGLVNYLKSTSEVMPAGLRIMTFLFVSKSGLESALEYSGVCTTDELSTFFKGFVQAHPLFNVVDVGAGKEKADHKLREHLDVFLRNPQTSKIFFGGSHDNGYMGTLAAAQTTGHMKKLVILRSYTYVAREIHNLQIPSTEIPGLFLPNKLPALFGGATPSRHYTPLPTPPLQNDSHLPHTAPDGLKPPASPKKHHAKPVRSRFSDSGTNRKQEKKRHPAPCNFKYLGAGCTNKSCKYGHDYELSQKEIEEIRINALKAPCRYINDGKLCVNTRCHLGHKCPRGPTCDYYARGQCKFVGSEMHI